MNISDMVSDEHGGITSFFVYTDIVEHQTVGDAHLPLLRVVKIGVIVKLHFRQSKSQFFL